MPQCTRQGSDCLKALIQSPICSPAQPASTTLPKGKPPAEVLPPSPHPTKKPTTHIEPRKSPRARFSLTCLAVNSAGDNACLPWSWGTEQLLTLCGFIPTVRLQNYISLSLRMCWYSCGTFNSPLRTTQLRHNGSCMTIQAWKMKVIRKDLGLWWRKKKCNC